MWAAKYKPLMATLIIMIIINCGGASSPTTSIIYDLYSNIFRNVGSLQLTQLTEVTTYSGSGPIPNLPSNFRESPHILTDDDGYSNPDDGCPTGCSPIVSITAAQHAAFVDCGYPLTSVALRTADCIKKNGATAIWIGSANGTGGQGNWYLVTRQGASNEVWQDGRTGLLWSSRLTPTSNGDNWCRASGNAESDDPFNVCNSPIYQPQYPTAESDCAEPSGAVPTPGWCSNGNAYTTAAACTGAGGTWTANPDNWSLGTYGPKKGGMGANAPTLKVRWRLPTINDYEQAQLDGLIFVMPDMGALSVYPSILSKEWSATIRSDSRDFAHQFWAEAGTNLDLRTVPYSVRCVGR